MSNNELTTALDRRKELLRRRLAESGLAAAPVAAAPVRRAEPGVPQPLSPGQRRMWFLQTRDPDDVTLNICVAYRLSGALDEARLRAAVATVVGRHAVLRTTYGVDADGEPYQVVRPDLEMAWQVHDLRDLPEIGRASRLEVLARREFSRPFDLTAEPPLRMSLVRTGNAEFALVLVVHHIAWDDNSWAVFFAELNAAYNGAAPLPELGAQFVDVAMPAVSAGDDAGLEYWRRTLRPLPEALELPGNARAGSGSAKQAERRTLALPGALVDRVEAFARAHAATPFMVWLAAFDAVIHRYTAATDFLVSVPVTVRETAAAEALIGYFGNTLLLRATISADTTFATFVAAVREACTGAFAHQSIGIDRVVREANPDRVSGRDGLEQLVRLGFSVRKSADGFAFDGIDSTQLELAGQVAQVPLGLTVVLEPEGAYLEAEYQVAVLESMLVEQLLDHCVQLLDSALASPDRSLGDIDILGPNDRATILALSHGAIVPTPQTTLVSLFEERVRATPDALAIVAPGARGGADLELDYAALNRRSNRLAHWLIGQGIGAEQTVGLRLSNSVEFVVAVFGVLKAGAAYLPIDPAYPDERIDYLVADAAPSLVLGRVELDAAEMAATGLPDTDPTDADRVRPLRPGNLAYVIYTSGSTGKPKGVPVAHAAIAEHLAAFVAEWSMTADDRLLQSSSVSFDASLLDIFVTLTLGARLVIPKRDAFRDIPYVAELITRCGVTVLHMVPSMLSTFLLLPDVSEWRALRHVPVGGEALPGEVADKFAGVFDAELRNHYGPTEAVVCATHMPVDGPQGTRIVPIGVPNQNVAVYLLDRALQLVPTGVVGEIYLGGAQLARGYLNRPGSTAERFVADPFAPGARLYRTGDLARRNSNGEIEFVGRADEQVKVRGFRIELGEVEAAISTHPAVGHCVVTVVADPAVGPMLAAYLVPAPAETGSGSIDLEQLRLHAAAVLPEYMVPRAFAVIDEIPLTINGKLDKRALPDPTPAVERRYREPATATERRMCAIFARLFKLDRVGADDSFFELGGHSLLAARLVAQIRAEFGVEFDVRVAFDTPTSAGLAERLVAQFRAEFDIDLDAMELDEPAESRSAATISVRPLLERRPRRGLLPLSYSQLAMWFQCWMEGPSAAGNLPFAVRLDGPLDHAALTAAVGDVVARHEALRTTFPESGGVPHQLVHPAAEVPVPITRIDADRIDAELAEIARYRFALDGEPLIRVRLLEVDAQTHVLSLLVHHMVADHASFGVFLADLVTAYRARIDAGRAPEWAPLPVQYADYALWQRDAFDPGAAGTPSAFGQSQLDYWRSALAGLPDEIAVAHDRPRPPVLGKRGEVVTFTVPPARRDGLTALAEQCGASEFMVYSAVVATVLHRLGGGSDIPLGTPVAGRVDETIEDLIGLFANMVVLRNDLSGRPTLRDTVIRSRDVVLDAHGHQELPIERLVEALNPPRSRARNPLFQSMIHFRGADWAPATLDLTGSGGTTATVLPVDFDISFLDLNLSFTVTPSGGLAVRVVVNADLYDPETAQLIADAVAATLDAYATVADTAVADLRILPESDLARLLAPPVAAVPAAATAVRTTGDGPRTETEQTLIALLEELLEITDVAADDGFFALGGDSVISIQWSARAAALGVPLTPQLVFEHPTIAELAAALDAAAEQPAQDTDPAQHGQVAHAPMSASGLDAEALAALTASWQARS
ncbi:non-ribosomal peptide synthetase [Nocardia sp. CS682]|uniref:non-ribosomal peptide synthetase n=1 Tax=Nocardia sp. CS682 TaxID=1047172 RepID=UPI0010750229|nr:non-ribosomal peptide synthetase [Nocardia sp. CS682]QBS42908.1 non-ribosomal peptide synthetase [Nocardia sp. CS682]